MQRVDSSVYLAQHNRNNSTSVDNIGTAHHTYSTRWYSICPCMSADQQLCYNTFLPVIKINYYTNDNYSWRINAEACTHHILITAIGSISIDYMLILIPCTCTCSCLFFSWKFIQQYNSLFLSQARMYYSTAVDLLTYMGIYYTILYCTYDVLCQCYLLMYCYFYCAVPSKHCYRPFACCYI